MAGAFFMWNVMRVEDLDPDPPSKNIGIWKSSPLTFFVHHILVGQRTTTINSVHDILPTVALELVGGAGGTVRFVRQVPALEHGVAPTNAKAY